MKYRQHFESAIEAIRREGRFRVFTNLGLSKDGVYFLVRCLD
jgi:hypothetical protein